MAVSELVTPARIDSRAKNYAIERGADASNYQAWYPNLAVSNQLLKDIRAGHLTTLQEFEQAMERENLEHGLVLGVAEADNKVAVLREEQLFGEKGLLSMGLGMLGFGSLTGFVGLMRKRPQDWSPEEVETVMKSDKETISERDKQLVELIRGVQRFLNLNTTDSTIAEQLKSELAKTQSASTKETVAKVKTTL